MPPKNKTEILRITNINYLSTLWIVRINYLWKSIWKFIFFCVIREEEEINFHSRKISTFCVLLFHFMYFFVLVKWNLKFVLQCFHFVFLFFLLSLGIVCKWRNCNELYWDGNGEKFFGCPFHNEIWYRQNGLY